MSVIRSPTRSGTVVGRCESQPDLSFDDCQHEFQDIKRIYIRNKRKQPDDDDSDSHIRNEISEMRKQMTQMMNMMATFTTNQKELFLKITEDITTIKEQITGLKLTNDNLALEQGILKSEMLKLMDENKSIEKKVETLNKTVEILQANNTSNHSKSLISNITQEDIIFEMNEREFRSRNIIIMGIAESTCSNSDERKTFDKKEAFNVTKQINEHCPEPEKVTRLGKYNNKKCRPLRVCFKSHEIAKSLLRNRTKINLINDSIKIYSDQTTQQQKLLKNLKEELSHRIEKGEQDLTIKYIKNTPKIVTKTSRNKMY